MILSIHYVKYTWQNKRYTREGPFISHKSFLDKFHSNKIYSRVITVEPLLRKLYFDDALFTKEISFKSK